MADENTDIEFDEWVEVEDYDEYYDWYSCGCCKCCGCTCDDWYGDNEELELTEEDLQLYDDNCEEYWTKRLQRIAEEQEY